MKQQEESVRGPKAENHSRSNGVGGRSNGRVANEEGLSALGHEMKQSGTKKVARHRTSKKTRRQRRVRRGVIIGLVVLLVIVGGGAGYTYYLTHDLNRIEVKGLNGALTTGKEAGTENILMVGSTSRCALTVQNPAYGLCSQGVNGVNSDVIMILHADPTHHRLALLSIPRDLFIPNARSDGANKVDAGLFEGLTQLVAAIEEDFGIPIQHAVSLNFDQFANIVDALGGINMSFPMSVFDAESGLNVQAATCVHLDGTQALQVVRARHLQYDSGTTSTYAEDWPQENLSDLARIRRDHEFLRVLGGGRGQAGTRQPDHRPQPDQLGQERPHLRPVVVGERHGQPGPRLPLGQHQLGAPAHPAGGRGHRSRRSRREPHLRGRELRGRRVPGPVAGPERHRPGPRHRAGHRLDDRQPAAGPGRR